MSPTYEILLTSQRPEIDAYLDWAQVPGGADEWGPAGGGEMGSADEADLERQERSEVQEQWSKNIKETEQASSENREEKGTAASAESEEKPEREAAAAETESAVASGAAGVDAEDSGHTLSNATVPEHSEEHSAANVRGHVPGSKIPYSFQTFPNHTVKDVLGQASDFPVKS